MESRGRRACRWWTQTCASSRATGFMSNRGRQNVASYLILDLGVDWRRGADWFEHQLVDHDVS